MLGDPNRSRVRSVVAVLSLTVAGALLVLAVLLLVATAFCGFTGEAPQASACRRELLFQAVRAAALAIPMGLIGALALGFKRT